MHKAKGRIGIIVRLLFKRREPINLLEYDAAVTMVGLAMDPKRLQYVRMRLFPQVWICVSIDVSDLRSSKKIYY